MTAQELKTTIIDQLKNLKVADRFVLVRFTSSMPKQQAVNALTTAEIALNHGSNKADVSAIDKLYGSELTTINSIIRQLREAGKSFGFPYWQSGTLNTGVSMLPSAAYGRFFARVQELNTALSTEVNRLADGWNDLLVRRSVALNGLFRPELYPTAEQFRNGVTARYNISPVPAGSQLQHMVDDLTGAAASALADQISTVDADQKKALAESLHRQLVKFSKECRNVEKVLSADKPRIFSTLFDELRGIVEGFAGVGLPAIEEVIQPLIDVVSDDPKDLVGETILQAETADLAKEAADQADMIAQQLASLI